MPVHWFCPECWSEVTEGAVVCPVCGATLAGAEERDLVQKFIAALPHLEPETAARAARTLGELNAQEAIPALTEALGQSDDPYLLEAEALGRIGTPEALAAPEEGRHDRSERVRRAVAEQLVKSKAA